jgi:hypothetical protein
MVENRGKFKSAGADYLVWAIRATNIFTSLALPRRNENGTIPKSRGRFLEWRDFIVNPPALTSKIAGTAPGAGCEP